ncbi:MAG: hypothetical protein IT307_18200 [Chloroflexi bacterium]|nr:hypothetical protein [Chloroflexota bacterium]
MGDCLRAIGAAAARAIKRPVPWRTLCAGLALFSLSAGLVRADADAQKAVLDQTSIVRQLPVLQDVPLDFIDKTRMRANLLSDDQTPEAIAEEETSRRLLVLLGLIPPDMNLHATLTDVLGQAIAGYYSSKEKKMFVVGDPNAFGPEARLTLAHEFTHALQDQHFHLEEMRASVKDKSDRSTAITSLIEGDAVVSSLLYYRQFLSAADQASLAASSSSGPNPFATVPLVIKDSILFPYRQGVDFVSALYRAGGIPRMNQVWADPPTSTEQIIHPERYLQRDQPVDVQLPDLAPALGDGWSVKDSDTLGELDFHNLLATYLDTRSADSGAAGWGGDQYAYLEGPNGAQAFVSSSVWDDTGQAQEFFGAYVTSVRVRFGHAASAQSDQPTAKLWATPGGLQLVQISGNRVQIIYAPDQAGLDRLTAALQTPVPAIV